MTVSTIATVASGLSRTLGNQNAKPSSVLSSLFASAPQSSATDTSNFTTAISLQNQIAQFRVAAQNVAQAGSVLSAAGEGISQISRELGKLKDLAAKAASVPLSASEREQINAEFQSIRSRIDGLANSTRFNNESLLDGSSPQLKIASENAATKDLSIGSLTDSALFEGANPNLLTIDNAKLAEDAIKKAQTYATTQQENVQALQDGLDYATSTLQTAIQNQDAANSTLNEGDLLNQLLTGSSNSLQANDITSLFAQTNRLPGNILQLLSE